jgi:hypothetical protein
MTATIPPVVMDVEGPTQALLALIESDRERQCAQILGEAAARAEAVRAQSRTEARARLRQAFEEQRHGCDERLAAAQAQLATRKRLHEQQRVAAWLRAAWLCLPAELQARWSLPEARATWVAQTLASARLRLPAGAWHISHAADWPSAERSAIAASLEGAPATFEADTGITAGLKIARQGNVIDGTLVGLLADRAAIESHLLRWLEDNP